MKMARWVKRVVMGVIVVILIALAAFVYYMSPFIFGSSMVHPGPKGLEKELDKNLSTYMFVVNYIQTLNEDIRWDALQKDELIYYPKTDEGYDSHTKKIEDKEAREAFDKLYDTGIIAVTTQKNYIEFCRWSGLDSSNGILYALDDQKIVLAFPEEDVNIVKPLSKKRWYYWKHVH